MIDSISSRHHRGRLRPKPAEPTKLKDCRARHMRRCWSRLSAIQTIRTSQHKDTAAIYLLREGACFPPRSSVLARTDTLCSLPLSITENMGSDPEANLKYEKDERRVVGENVARGVDEEATIPKGQIDPVYEAKARVLNRAVRSPLHVCRSTLLDAILHDHRFKTSVWDGTSGNCSSLSASAGRATTFGRL